MSESRRRSERRSWLRLSPRGVFITLIAGLRIIAQTAEHPDRASQNLLIFSTVVVSTVFLGVSVLWTFAIMKVRVRRKIVRMPVANNGKVLIGRVDMTFIRALTPYSTDGQPVSNALGNPVVLITASGLSIWKGVIAPVKVASLPAESVGRTTLLQSRHLGITHYQLETTLLDNGPGRSLSWRIQSLGWFGLQPAGRKVYEDAIQALNNLWRSV